MQKLTSGKEETRLLRAIRGRMRRPQDFLIPPNADGTSTNFEIDL